MLSEASFREKEFEQAKEKILDVSHYIYREIANGRIFAKYPAGSIAYGMSDSLSVFTCLLDKHKDCNRDAKAAPCLGTFTVIRRENMPLYLEMKLRESSST